MPGESVKEKYVMTFQTFNLTPESYDLVRTRIESGRYENTAAIMHAALQALHREELKLDAKLSVNSIAACDPFRKLWEAAA